MDQIFAVITGASQGLGKAFAEVLARDNKNLLLISLPNEGLPDLCAQLEKQFPIKVECYETDLSIHQNVLALTQWINQNFKIDILINNAGVGGTKSFEEVPISYVEKIILLNVLATSTLTHQLLPNLRLRDQGFILNVSSLAAFSPIAYKTVYPASKAFIYSFSRGLHQELKDTNVSVSVINPGPMKTNGNTIERINKQGVFTRMALQEPSKVAYYSIKKMKEGKSIIVTSWLNWIVLKILPTWISIPILSGKFKNELNV